MASELEWTIVRCAFSAQNFSEGAWLDEVLAGFVSVPIEEYTAMLTEYGLPQDFIWLLNHLFTEVLGSKVQLADGVQRALGREPKDFTDYADDTAATGVWTV